MNEKYIMKQSTNLVKLFPFSLILIN